MDETLRRICSHPIPLLRDSDVQLSLSKKECIRIQKKGFISKVAHLFIDEFHVKLSELSQNFSTSSSVLPQKYNFLHPLMLDN